MPSAMLLDAVSHGAPRPIPGFRLRTVIGMRWFATLGQFLVVSLVAFGLGWPLPLGPLLVIIALGVWGNLYTVLTHRPGEAMTERILIGNLVFDTLQITGVLFLTGGIHNPFCVWLVMPAMLAASSLPRPQAAGILGLVIACLTLLALAHEPLPWGGEGSPDLPVVYTAGLWAALVLAVGFTAAYAHGVAANQARIAAALSATQQVLAQEERLSALDGLAAAAAHELGTPLGTIQVVAREMERELDGELKDDAGLLISQTQRCQRILERLSAQGQAGDAVHDVVSLDELLKAAAKPFLEGGPTGEGPRLSFRFDPGSEGPMPSQLRRAPEVIYGLRNVIENAAKYAEEAVEIEARWRGEFLTVRVADDGPGFPPEVLRRLGEPYPRGDAKPQGPASGKGGLDKGGLGLGFFIAKTLVERSGARLQYGNRPRAEGGGAWVEAVWPLASLTPRPKSRGRARPIETAPLPA